MFLLFKVDFFFCLFRNELRDWKVSEIGKRCLMVLFAYYYMDVDNNKINDHDQTFERWSSHWVDILFYDSAGTSVDCSVLSDSVLVLFSVFPFSWRMKEICYFCCNVGRVFALYILVGFKLDKRVGQKKCKYTPDTVMDEINFTQSFKLFFRIHSFILGH